MIRFHSDEFIIGVALNIFAGGLTTFLLRTIFQVKGSFSDPRIVPLPTITIPGVKDIPVLGHLPQRKYPAGLCQLDLGAGLLVPDLQDPVGVPPAGQRRISRCAGGQRSKPRKDETQRQCTLRRAELHGGRAPVAGLPDHVLREYVGLPRICGLRLRDLRPGQPAIVFLAALLFGFIEALGLRLQKYVPSDLTGMAPYLVTVIMMVAVVLWERKKKNKAVKAEG